VAALQQALRVLSGAIQNNSADSSLLQGVRDSLTCRVLFLLSSLAIAGTMHPQDARQNA
jgi:hypothetical protein